MPPWSSRLLSPSSRHEASPTATIGNASSPARQRPRVTEADIIDNALGIPSLQPTPRANYGALNNSKPVRTPSHGRSMSHPFPSLFAGKKKPQGESAEGIGFESTDDDAVSPVKRTVPSNISTKQKVPDKDLTMGRCMTCDSMVRWPNELKVYRCTVCLTINDLRPIALEARPGDGLRAPIAAKAGTFPGSRFTQYSMPRRRIFNVAVLTLASPCVCGTYQTNHRPVYKCISSGSFEAW
jgi:E3 ubiquitin-protein ligase HECTD2